MESFHECDVSFPLLRLILNCLLHNDISISFIPVVGNSYDSLKKALQVYTMKFFFKSIILFLNFVNSV